MLLDRAVKAGAEIEKTRVLGMERQAAGWRLRTKTGSDRSRLLHRCHRRAQLAARCRHATHRGRHDVRARLLCARRCAITSTSNFCRAGRLHLGVSPLRASVGGHLRQGRAGAMRCGAPRNSTWTSTDSAVEGATFYSHMLPSLDTPAWKNNRVAGAGLDGGGRRRGLGRPDHRRRSLLCHALGRSGRAGARRELRSRTVAPPPIAVCSAATSRDDLEFGSRLAKQRLPRQVSCSAPSPAAWCSSRAAARASLP